jgi:hypothetical protein
MKKPMEFTITQKLRLFLARSGQAVAPWSSGDEVMDRLYGLLYDRREQDGLWHDLAALLDSLQSEARGMLASPEAEILPRARVDSLVAELRRAMRASLEAPAAGAMRRFSVGKSAGVSACIALLAATFSLGCGSSESRVDALPPDTAIAKADTASSVPKDTGVLLPDAANVLLPDTATGQPADTAALSPDVASNDGASGDAGEPADAIGDGSTGDALMDLFRDGTPADIAAKLEASVEAGTPDRPLDRPMVIYKGVSFPAGQNG